MIFLDTNVVIALINRPVPAVRQAYNAARASGTPLLLSSIVVFELCYGVARSVARARNASILRAFLTDGPEVASFDSDDAASAAEIRATLAAAGTPIGPYDVLIAGQALRHGATLVTANTREFARVPGLKVEDWAKR
ncbi:MAG: type II toxin-antitoxin system VapC family toxin [Hyphomicrobiaceae bacterium]